ncbi:STAS domain-containing protein [Streptomyces cirratus]
MSPLTITVRDADTGPVMRVTVTSTSTPRPQLRQSVDALTLAPGELLVLDLGGLEFCDSSGISALITAHNRGVRRAGVMALAAVTGQHHPRPRHRRPRPGLRPARPGAAGPLTPGPAARAPSTVAHQARGSASGHG